MATPALDDPASVRAVESSALADLILLSAVLTLAGVIAWLAAGSDDDNGGGGLMQPVLVPVRSVRHQRWIAGCTARTQRPHIELALQQPETVLASGLFTSRENSQTFKLLSVTAADTHQMMVVAVIILAG